MSLKKEMEGKFTPVIVKVLQSNYIPTGMTIRMRINDLFFTADCVSQEMLNSARSDPLVVSVEVS